MRKFILFLVSAWYITSAAGAQPLGSEEEAFALRSRAIIQKQAEYYDFTGVLLVAKGDRILLEESAGWASYRNKEALREDHQFMIASLSKGFTALAVMQLVADGLLDTEHSLACYLPEFPAEWAEKVKIRHLLDHSSGIPDYINDDFVGFRLRKLYHPHPETADLEKWIASRELKNEPGAYNTYTNSGYFLLSRVVEEISGQDFCAYLREHILQPAALEDCDCDDFNRATRPAEGHRRDFVSRRTAPNLSVEWVQGMGGMYATAEDLHRYMLQFFQGDLLPDAFRDQMLDDENGPYGFGWMIFEDEKGKYYSHGGHFPGWNSEIRYYPVDDLYLVLLTNLEGINAFQTANSFKEIYDQNRPVPEALADLSGEAPLGRYACDCSPDEAPAPVVQIDAGREGLLALRLPDGHSLGLRAVGNDEFADESGKWRIRVLPEENEIRVFEKGAEWTYRKLPVR